MEDNKDLILTEDKPVSLNTPLEQLKQKLLTENDLDKLDDIINIFNLNIKRKDIVRTSKLNDLQDKIADQMALRLTEKANEFSNKDLLDYFKVLQDTINKSDNSLESIDTPAIQINQQQINIGEETELNRESREKVKNAVASFLENNGYDLDELNKIKQKEKYGDY